MEKDHAITYDAGDKTEMESYTVEAQASTYDDKQTVASLHDDADLGAHTAEVGKGLQRNLAARHLTMISLGKHHSPSTDSHTRTHTYGPPRV